jgi:hypothetical protein
MEISIKDNLEMIFLGVKAECFRKTEEYKMEYGKKDNIKEIIELFEFNIFKILRIFVYVSYMSKLQ